MKVSPDRPAQIHPTTRIAAIEPCADGRWVVVAGPDGVGKTTFATALVEALGPAPTRHIHHRFGILPRSARSRMATSAPHGQRPYPRWLAVIKVGYLYLDHVGGWLSRWGLARRPRGWLIQERGWLDLAVDPRRYRLQGVGGLVAALMRIAPRPDVTVLLDAPAAVMRGRAPELPEDELERQRATWLDLAPRQGRTLMLDSRVPVTELVERALETLRAAGPPWGRLQRPAVRAGSGNGGGRWARLPSARSPRWWIPAWPPTVASASLAVYQPMTFRGLIGWGVARLVARGGGLLLLGTPEPPREQASLAGRIPPDAVVAVGAGPRAGRAVALAIDPHGTPVALAKIRTDLDGAAALAHEAEMIERFVPLLPPSLMGPRLIGQDEGLLLFEPAAWRPRLRPWILPVTVAAGLGTFYRAGGGGAAGGPAHGDFAPWNLLRVAGGWMLLDWADATPEAMPFFDPLHYLVQAYALLGRPSAKAILAGLGGRGWVGEALRAYAAAAGLDPTTAPRYCAEYLAGTLPSMDPARADGRRGAVARQRLLAELDYRARGRRPAR